MLTYRDIDGCDDDERTSTELPHPCSNPGTRISSARHSTDRTQVQGASGLFSRIQTLRTAANAISSLGSFLASNNPPLEAHVSHLPGHAKKLSYGSPPTIDISVNVHTQVHTVRDSDDDNDDVVLAEINTNDGKVSSTIWAGSPRPSRRRSPTVGYVQHEASSDTDALQLATSAPSPSLIRRLDEGGLRDNSYQRRHNRAQQVSSAHVKRLLSSFYEPPRSGHEKNPSETDVTGPLDVVGRSPTLSNQTPPLTPDSLLGGAEIDESILSLTPQLPFYAIAPPFHTFHDARPPVSDSIYAHSVDSRPQMANCRSEDGLYAPALSHEVREGKKPIQSSEIAGTVSEDLDHSDDQADMGDGEGWFGLRYALELSTRERHRSQTNQSIPEGEHSKSLTSWAVLHQEFPTHVEEAYRHWCEWHEYLDHQDELRRMRRHSSRVEGHPADDERHIAICAHEGLGVHQGPGTRRCTTEGAWWVAGRRREPKGHSVAHSTWNTIAQLIPHGEDYEELDGYDCGNERPHSLGCIRELQELRSNRF